MINPASLETIIHQKNHINDDFKQETVFVQPKTAAAAKQCGRINFNIIFTKRLQIPHSFAFSNTKHTMILLNSSELAVIFNEPLYNFKYR